MQDPQLTSFGIHQATFKDLVDPTFWAMAKILGSAEPDLKQEMIPQTGGSAVVPWNVAPSSASGEISMEIRQYDTQLMRFLAPYVAGSQVETPSGEAGGSVTTIENSVGVSVVDATTGVASIAVAAGSETDLSPGGYKIVATGAATVDIYVDTDVTGQVEYQDSNLKINDTPITIPGTGGTVTFQGIEFTGGSGAIALVTGDIADFSVNPINNYVLQSFFGKTGACQREFELVIYGECTGTKIRSTRFPRCVASASTPLKFMENEWASMEATIYALQPATVDYVAESTFLNR